MDSKLLNGQFFHPFSMIVAGSSMSGKTEFTIQLLLHREQLINKPIDLVVWCYGQPTERLSSLKSLFGTRILLIQGLPKNLEEIIASRNVTNTIVVLDDLMDEVCDSNEIKYFFTRGVHHLNISIICIVQDIFYGGKFRKTLFRNSHYLVMFKSPMDLSLVDLVGRKLMPRRLADFQKLFERATKEPFSYLLIAGHPKTPAELRYRSDIFGDYQRIHRTITN